MFGDKGACSIFFSGQAVNMSMFFQIDHSFIVFGKTFYCNIFFRSNWKIVTVYLGKFMHGRMVI